MAVLELDSKGYIKGTNKLYQSKVVVLKRFSSNGSILLPGNVITLTGDALITCLNLGKVRYYNPELDEKPGKVEDKKQTKKKSKK